MFKNNYYRNKFFALFQVMLFPFMSVAQRMVIDGGGGGMSAHEQQEAAKAIHTDLNLLKKNILDLSEKLESAEKGNVSVASIEDLKLEINKQVSELEGKVDLDKINKELNAQGAALKKLQEQVVFKGKTAFDINKGTLKNLLSTALDAVEIDGRKLVETIKGDDGTERQEVRLGAGKRVHMKFDFDYKKQRNKAGENIFLTGSTTEAVFNQAINRFIYGEDRPALTANDHMIDKLPVKNVTGSHMTLLVYNNYEDGAQLVAEGVKPTQDSRLEATSRDFKVFAFAATATCSKELLRDKNELIDELVFQLRDSMLSKLDDNILQGAGNNVDLPYGAFNTTESCVVFNPLNYTGVESRATVADVLGKCKLDARLYDYRADTFIANPKVLEGIEADKATDDNSVMDRRVVFSNGEVVSVARLSKIDTTKISENELYVATSGLHDIGLRQSMELEFGYINEDFKNRKVSLVLDMRAGYGVRNKAGNIYVDDLAGAIEIMSLDAAGALALVNGYAVASDAADLTIATLTATGAQNVIAAQLGGYKTAIAAETGIANLAALQAIIDTVNP